MFEDGLGVRNAAHQALQRAEVAPERIDYINPHATSTLAGDLAEVRALRHVFGACLNDIPMSATKSMVGHMLGGAGAAEAVAVVCSLRDQKIHPSINVDELDPAFEGIQLATSGPREAEIAHALKISAGFGGHNCALVFGHASA